MSVLAEGQGLPPAQTLSLTAAHCANKTCSGSLDTASPRPAGSQQWLFECTVQEFLLVITCLETNEELERWQFDIEFDKAAKRAVPPERLGGVRKQIINQSEEVRLCSSTTSIHKEVQDKVISPEKSEEAKLKSRYPFRKKTWGVQKGQKNFDSGDYNMAKAKMKSKQLPTAAPEETEITGPR
ncbi:hypothetical protein NQZ68_031031 [Dissostichus eleginoides]|nr:hypothetical protein NQZ68_031031 [Dissostichus eleginoides]